MNQQIKEKIEQIEKMKESLNQEIGKIFSSSISEIMNKCNLIEDISFTCYTPYFNDGEECVYSVNSNISFNDDEDLYSSPYYIDYDSRKLSREEKVLKFGEETVLVNEIIGEIEEFIEEIPNDFYRSTFGDHVKVTVKKDRTFFTNSYDHD